MMSQSPGTRMFVQHFVRANNKGILKVWVSAWRTSNAVSFSLWLQWRHKGRDNVSNHQPHDCLLNRLFRRRSKKTSKLRVTGLCVGNSPVTGEFPAQMASNAENVSIWWCHHAVGASETITVNRARIQASKHRKKPENYLNWLKVRGALWIQSIKIRKKAVNVSTEKCKSEKIYK